MSDSNIFKWKRKESHVWLDNEFVEQNQIEGEYEIEFKELEGYAKPPNAFVTLHHDGVKEVHAEYVKLKDSGNLKIIFIPDIASVASVKWRLANTETWYDNKELVTKIPVGTYPIDLLLNDYVSPTGVLEATIEKGFTTEIAYPLNITGKIAHIIESIELTEKTITATKRTPSSKCIVTIIGAEGITNSTHEIDYGNSLTVEFNAGYVFKLGGLKTNLITTGPIKILNDHQLITGPIFEDCEYKFEVTWVQNITEDIGNISTSLVTGEKQVYNKKLNEELGVTSDKQLTVEKRNAFKIGAVEEAIDVTSITEISATKTKLVYSEFDNATIGSDKITTAEKTNYYKTRYGTNENISFTCAVISDVSKINSMKTLKVAKDEVLLYTDIILRAAKTIKIQTVVSEETLSVPSNTFMCIERKDLNSVKTSFQEEFRLTSDTVIEASIDNRAYQKVVSDIEEIGLNSNTSLTATRENKLVNLETVEEVGITSDKELVVDKLSRLRSSNIVDDIGLLSSIELAAVKEDKEIKAWNVVEEIGIVSNVSMVIDKENKSIIKSSVVAEEVGVSSNSFMEIEKHSHEFITISTKESVGMGSVLSVTAVKFNPVIQRHIIEEECGISSCDIQQADIRTVHNSVEIVDEVGFGSDIIISLQKQNQMKRSSVDTDISLFCDVISNAVITKSTAGCKPSIAINVDQIVNVEVTNRVRKGITSESGMIASDSFMSVSKTQPKVLPLTIIENVGILSNVSISVDRHDMISKYKKLPEAVGVMSVDIIEAEKNDTKILNTLPVLEELGITSDEELNAVITDKEIKSLPAIEEIGITSDTEIIATVTNKEINIATNEEIGVTSDTEITAQYTDKEIKPLTNIEEVGFTSGEITQADKKVS